MDFHPTHHS